MIEGKIAEEMVKTNVVKEIYSDSLQPSARIVGKSIAQFLSLFASPIGRIAEILEKNLNKYFDKLENDNQSELVEPDARLAVPILEKLRYVEDEKVSDYYVEILAAASKKDQKNRVMLSYIEILNRVTADELKILEYINSDQNYIEFPNLNQNEMDRYGLSKDSRLSLGGNFPIIDVMLFDSEIKHGGFQTIVSNFNILDEKIVLDDKDNMNPYIDNLISLGLIIKPTGKRFSITPIYNHLKNHIKITSLELEKNHRIEFAEGKIELTDLCKSLLSLCQKKIIQL